MLFAAAAKRKVGVGERADSPSEKAIHRKTRASLADALHPLGETGELVCAVSAVAAAQLLAAVLRVSAVLAIVGVAVHRGHSQFILLGILSGKIFAWGSFKEAISEEVCGRFANRDETEG